MFIQKSRKPSSPEKVLLVGVRSSCGSLQSRPSHDIQLNRVFPERGAPHLELAKEALH
jgi:hypothetical protein